MINHIQFGENDKSKKGFKLKWVSTDGWRGYNDVVAPKGYKNIHSDWVTGDYEDTGEHASSKKEALIKEFEKKHKNVFVVTSPTSNVFSTGLDVFVGPETKEKKTSMAKKMKSSKGYRKCDVYGCGGRATSGSDYCAKH